MSLNKNAKEFVPSWLKTTEKPISQPIPTIPQIPSDIENPSDNSMKLPPNVKSDDLPDPDMIRVPGIDDEAICEVIKTPVDDVEEEEEEEEVPVVIEEADPREHLNVVFVGHVDAGKSTLSGKILLLTGQVDKRTIEKYEREAILKHRESWFLAYIMDTNEEERLRGITVEVGRAHFETKNKRFTIIDAPGHKSYVPNMIAGAAQADIAVMMISARKGEFEAGFDNGGQTREHAMLLKTLGIRKIVVALNKMDDPTVQYRQQRFDDIVKKLLVYFAGLGYKSDDLSFLPLSALSGGNVMEPFAPELCNWYKGKCLIEILDNMTIEGRDPNAPLRMPILDKYFDRGLCAVGKVESGTIAMGDKILIMPGKIQVEVSLIEVDEKAVNHAQPGDNIELHLKGTSEEYVHRGYVICSRINPCPCVDKIEALLKILEIQSLFSAGYEAVLHCHTAVVECIVLKLLETKERGKTIPHPVFVKSNSPVRVLIQLNQPLCLEAFDTLQALGRFSLRDEGVTIAIGKVLKLHTANI